MQSPAVATALAGYSLEKYRGLGRRMPITAMRFLYHSLRSQAFHRSMVSGASCITGAGINSGQIVEWGPWLAIAGVLNSALTWLLCLDNEKSAWKTLQTCRVKDRGDSAVLVFAIVFMVAFGIWHAPLLDFASSAVPELTSSNITQASTVTGGVEKQA